MTTLTPHIHTPTPHWVPASVRGMLRGPSRFAFDPSERRVMRKRPPIRPSVWAERHRKLTMSAIPGPWKNDVTPYLTDIMDAADFPSVETTIVMACPQSGKTEAAHNFVGCKTDRAPGPVMYVFPDRDTAGDNSKDRIQPMIQDSPRLRGYMTGVDDDKSKMRIKLKHTVIYLAWSGSVTSLANKPCRYVIFDEVDKYQHTGTSKETDPISLGEKRANTYRASRKAKIWKMSTPTVEAGAIFQAYSTEAQVRFAYHVACPECGHFHLPLFDYIKFPKDVRDPEKVLAENLAWYECPKCLAKWDDEMRNAAVRAGGWRSEGSEQAAVSSEQDRGRGGGARGEGRIGLTPMAYLEAYRPKKIAFHLPAWVSPFVSLAECAAAFLRGLTDKNKFKDFQNSYAAWPWVLHKSVRKEDAVLALCDDRPRGRVPGGGVVAGLVAGVDTQDVGFWYEVRAFGWGLDGGSWQIREGYVETFTALEQVLFEDRYEDADGVGYLVHLAVQDAMGHRTSEVYDFCRRHRGRVIPSQGVDRMNQPFTFSDLEYYPGTSKKIPGGLKLCRVNTTHMKNALSGKLDIAPGDPGAWMYHAETTRDWAKMMTAEVLDEQGLWQNPHNRPNHGWDCSVLCIVAAEILGIRFWSRAREQSAPPPPMPRPDTASKPTHGRSRPGWFNNRGR